MDSLGFIEVETPVLQVCCFNVPTLATHFYLHKSVSSNVEDSTICLIYAVYIYAKSTDLSEVLI